MVGGVLCYLAGRKKSLMEPAVSTMFEILNYGLVRLKVVLFDEILRKHLSGYRVSTFSIESRQMESGL